jgi:ParB-like chromosome segregation protein Spo0J
MSQTTTTPEATEPAPRLSRLHPGELHESPSNPRQISDERFAALKYALDQDPEMMAARPIIATPDGEVVAGNMRLRAALELGWESVPVFIAELDEARKREWMLRDNNEYGEWVPEELAALLKEHADTAGDMELLGFASDDIDAIVRNAAKGAGIGAGASGDPPPPEVWGVVVECESESQQAELLERLDLEGFNVRALL